MIAMLGNMVVTIPVPTVSLEPILIVSTVWAKGALGTWVINKSMISPTVQDFWMGLAQAEKGFAKRPAPRRAPDCRRNCRRGVDFFMSKKNWRSVLSGLFGIYSTVTSVSQMKRLPAASLCSKLSWIGPKATAFSQVQVRPSGAFPFRKVHSRI